MPSPDPTRDLIEETMARTLTTQEGLAALLGVNPVTLRSWITAGRSRRAMPETARRLALALAHDPDLTMVIAPEVVEG